MPKTREFGCPKFPKAKSLSILAFGMLAIFPSSVFSQVAPVAPLSERDNSKPSSRNTEPTDSGERNNLELIQQARIVEFNRGDEALKQGDFERAIRAFRSVIVPPKDWRDEDDTKAHRGLMAAYSGKRDFETTLFYANQISRKPAFASDLLHFMAGNCYQELQQHPAAIDFLRLAASQSEDDHLSQHLALSLVQTTVPSLRDGKEALAWLADQRDLVEREPRVAKIFALAAAESGDFKLAVNMQRGLIDRVLLKDRASETALLALYEKHQKPPIKFPAFDHGQKLSKDQLAARARRSSVYVIVSGLASDGITDEESTIVKVVKYHHMGIVLNKLGTILVSSETINLPHMIENDARSPRAKRWVKEPAFKVWAIVDEAGTVQELGKANIVGNDFETGLAVLQIDRTDHAYEPIPEIEPIQFQPEHRWYNPAWLAFSESYFELNDAELVARKGGHLHSRTYPLSIDRPQVSGTSAQFVECDQSQAKVGSPLFNAFGECIGLVHLINNQQSDMAAIPSTICSRVASKLCAFGFVPRVHSPMVVSSVSESRTLPSGEEEVVQSGMYVSELRSADPNLTLKSSTFQKLVGTVILSVDGHPTPTHTEWLIALERIAFSGREQQEIELEVVDGEWKNQRTIALRFQPVVRAGGAQ